MKYIVRIDGVLLCMQNKRVVYDYYRQICYRRGNFDLLPFKAPVEDLLHELVQNGARFAQICYSGDRLPKYIN